MDIRFASMFSSTSRLLPLLLVPALFNITGCAKQEEKPQAAPPDVLVSEVAERDVPHFEELVATLNGPVNADITPKVQGYLLKQDYVNGMLVRKGQLLFEVDPRPFVASLDQAKANVAEARANLDKCNNDVTRDTPLAAQNVLRLNGFGRYSTSRAPAGISAERRRPRSAYSQVALPRLLIVPSLFPTVDAGAHHEGTAGMAPLPCARAQAK
jgi:multidrug efflux pump subunit AcrA (membrane-fusion protein)